MPVVFRITDFACAKKSHLRIGGGLLTSSYFRSRCLMSGTEQGQHCLLTVSIQQHPRPSCSSEGTPDLLLLKV